ncbi:unnamed protein product [Wickerhamomyces anomalus]
MSEFARLLKTSRLSALPKPQAKTRGRNYPQQPIIETRANALARNEWGLKYPLPSKIKSRYLSFNQLDNMEHMVDFETNASFHLKRQRFQETGLVPQYETPRENPLFYDSSKSTSRFVTLTSLCNLTTRSDPKIVMKTINEVEGLREEFKQWLLKKDPSILLNKNFNQNDMVGPAVEFLSEINAKKPVDTVSDIRHHNKSQTRFQGTGGLSYSLKGRLPNSPNGVEQTYVGPGRITNSGLTARTVAFGGFTAEVPNTSSALQNTKAQADGKSTRETVIPFAVEKAVFTDEGQIKIRTNTVSKRSEGMSDVEFNKKQYELLAGRRAQNVRHEKAEVDDLLKLIQSTARR